MKACRLVGAKPLYEPMLEYCYFEILPGFTTAAWTVLQIVYTNEPNTVKPVSNDHLYNRIYYLWFIQ